MNKTIHKFGVEAGCNEAWALQTSASHFKPIAVQLQGAVPTVWAEVSADGDTSKKVMIFVVATGGWLPSHLTYIGTVQMPDGTVRHYYF